MYQIMYVSCLGQIFYMFLLIKSNYLFQLAADPDPNVKNGAELLDRLIKVGQQWKFISEMQISNMQFKYLNFLMMVGQGVH